MDEPEVWSELGHSQLEANEGGDAIESYLRSADHSRHAEVIQRSTQAGAHAQLVKYLLMVRKKVKDPKVIPPNPSATDSICKPQPVIPGSRRSVCDASIADRKSLGSG